MDSRDNQILLKLKSESLVVRFLTKGLDYDSFSEDERTKRAVTMTLVNIGELVNALTEGYRKEHNDIPWRDIIATRNIIAHHYLAVDFRTIWETANTSIPEFLVSIDGLLREASN
jgi:uncharacterized protein with HEPN domain